MKNSKKALLIAVFLIIIGSICGNLVETNFGKVTIKEVKFTGPYGNVIEGYLYIPKGVNKDNPAPAIINIHGYLNTKEFQNSFSTEYARRGYVVLAIDMPGHGYSDPVPGGLTGFFTGGPSAFNFLYSLDIVDKEKIAIEGHSMGGWNAVSATEIYGDKINTIVLIGSSSGTFGQQNFGPESPFNVGIVFGKADEFVAMNWEVLDAREINSSVKMKSIFGIDEDVINGRLYGSFEDKSARTLYQIDTTHAGEHLSKEGVSAAVDFVQRAMPASNPIPATNQIWQYQELCKLVNLIGITIFIFSFGTVLLDTNYFSSLKQVHNKKMCFYKSPFSLIVFGLMATSIPAITYIQFYGLNFLNASFLEGKAWRPQGLTFSIEIWALVNSGIMLGMFLLWHNIYAKKEGATLVDYGLSTSADIHEFKWKYIGKTLLLAILIMGTVEAIAIVVGTVFKIDFRYWVVGFKALNVNHFSIMLVYIIPFFIFYLLSGLAGQSYLKAKEAEGKIFSVIKNYLFIILVNSIGMIVLVAIQYIGAWSNGIGTFTGYELEGIVAIQFIILLPFSGVISNYFTRKTGNIYLGSMINAIFITGYIVVSQAVHYFPGY